MHSGGFSNRSKKADVLVDVIEKHILTKNNYFQIRTGIEHRFGKNAKKVHDILYRSMGPTTDLLRYFPDSLFLDRWRVQPTWKTEMKIPELLPGAANLETPGLYSFFVEYKFSDSERKAPLAGVPTKFIGIIEREAWLTYRRLTAPNPTLGIYLDHQFTRIALFYAALYAPDVLYAGWEHELHPIDDPRAIRNDMARPNQKSVGFSTGSGTPWINFDIRTLKPLKQFLIEDLYWESELAGKVTKKAVDQLVAQIG